MVDKIVDIVGRLDYRKGLSLVSYVEVKIKIGIDKMYSLNNKLNKFIPIIKDKKGF